MCVVVVVMHCAPSQPVPRSPSRLSVTAWGDLSAGPIADWPAVVTATTSLFCMPSSCGKMLGELIRRLQVLFVGGDDAGPCLICQLSVLEMVASLRCHLCLRLLYCIVRLGSDSEMGDVANRCWIQRYIVSYRRRDRNNEANLCLSLMTGTFACVVWKKH